MKIKMAAVQGIQVYWPSAKEAHRPRGKLKLKLKNNNNQNGDGVAYLYAGHRPRELGDLRGNENKITIIKNQNGPQVGYVNASR